MFKVSCQKMFSALDTRFMYVFECKNEIDLQPFAVRLLQLFVETGIQRLVGGISICL